MKETFRCSGEAQCSECWPNSAVRDASDGLKTATVLLWLRVENNNKFVRGKKRARENIERYHLQRYAAERRSSGEYELKVPFRDEEDLDQTMDELFCAIADEAELRCCFTEPSAHLEGDEEGPGELWHETTEERLTGRSGK